MYIFLELSISKLLQLSPLEPPKKVELIIFVKSTFSLVIKQSCAIFSISLLSSSSININLMLSPVIFFLIASEVIGKSCEKVKPVTYILSSSALMSVVLSTSLPPK